MITTAEHCRDLSTKELPILNFKKEQLSTSKKEKVLRKKIQESNQKSKENLKLSNLWLKPTRNSMIYFNKRLKKITWKSRPSQIKKISWDNLSTTWNCNLVKNRNKMPCWSKRLQIWEKIINFFNRKLWQINLKLNSQIIKTKKKIIPITQKASRAIKFSKEDNQKANKKRDYGKNNNLSSKKSKPNKCQTRKVSPQVSPNLQPTNPTIWLPQ